MPKILLLAALMLTSVGCVREFEDTANEGTDPSPGELAVEVLITDGSIEMPAEIPGGPVLFEVTNNGTSEHGFAIEGVDEKIDSLRIDELATLHTELDPGTYTVFSPVEGDRDSGLEVRLTVTEETAPGSTPPLGDEAIGPSEEQVPIDEDGG